MIWLVEEHKPETPLSSMEERRVRVQIAVNTLEEPKLRQVERIVFDVCPVRAHGCRPRSR